MVAGRARDDILSPGPEITTWLLSLTRHLNGEPVSGEETKQGLVISVILDSQQSITDGTTVVGTSNYWGRLRFSIIPHISSDQFFSPWFRQL